MPLDISDDERRDLKLFWEAFDAHRAALSDALVAWVERIPELAAIVRATPPELMKNEDARSRELQRKAIVDGDWEPLLADQRAQGTRYAQMGLSFGAWYELLRGYRVVFAPIVREHFRGDVDKIVRAISASDRLLDIGMATVGTAYLDTKQDIIARQGKAIRELSTPVLQVKERLLIVPLVGVIDTERARQVTENVLHAIRSRRARAVVIDITGVPVVDSKVASHLMQTVNAAGLMGATVICCGMSPDIAQTLVTIGAELRGVHTAGDLEEAIEEADAILRARFRPDDAPPPPASAPAAGEA